MSKIFLSKNKREKERKKDNSVEKSESKVNLECGGNMKNKCTDIIYILGIILTQKPWSSKGKNYR